MNALVISGGGAKGAFAGGVAEFLIKECGKQYDLIIGTSTGSMLAPLLSIGEIERLKTIYTSVTQKDIFKVCPFIIRKQGSQYKVGMHHLNMIRMFLTGKKTFGDSRNLRDLIARTIRLEDFQRMQESQVKVLVTVANLSQSVIEYKSSQNSSYGDFLDWMWASANFVPFMSLVRKNGLEFADGGFGDNLPIQEAVNQGALEIDAIVLHPPRVSINNRPVRNAFSSTMRVFNFMMRQIRNDDLSIGTLEARGRDVRINLFHTPRILTENGLIFDPELMTAWWKEGCDYARATTPTCRSLLADETLSA